MLYDGECMCVCTNCIFQVCYTRLTASASYSSCEGDTHLQCVVCDSGNGCFFPFRSMTDCVCVILQAMNHETLKEMKKALGENKTIETLTLSGIDVTLPKEFCQLLMFSVGCNASLSKLYLQFHPDTWNCLNDGRLVYVSHSWM